MNQKSACEKLERALADERAQKITKSLFRNRHFERAHRSRSQEREKERFIKVLSNFENKMNSTR